MTHYWWMHWFWITCLFYIVSGQTILTTLHSMATTDVPSVLNNRTLNIFPTEKTEPPPSNLSPVASRTNFTNRKNVTMVKYAKLSQKKLDLLLSNVNSSKKISFSRDLTVINQENVTEPTNMSDNNNTSMMNASLNNTETLSYISEEPVGNQSLIQNAGIIGVEEDQIEPENSSGNLSAAGITGITLACVVIVGIICGVSFFLYQNRGFNRPQVLNDRCSNPDSSGYIDDASVRDNSEEMYSLDNDSFLNSLEAMTIQNYWTDTVKHTKL